ncbi:MAG: peptidylprolyl isomerase [Oscillospiraceae bacterium]|nr:peptidylprolyl isomerase [Oscillospiraceae bacterium]
MRKIISLSLVLMFVLAFTACKQENSSIYNTALTGGNLGEVVIESGDTYAVITIENFGDITIKLFPECAPVAVDNFIKLAEEGYYDGKNLHRIIKDFMIQGGSPNGDGLSDLNEPTFGVELSYNARHFYGALCMANAGGRNSQQFYIVNDKNPQTLRNVADMKRDIDTVNNLLKNNIYFDGRPLDENGRREYIQMREQFQISLDYRQNITDEIIEKYKEGGASHLDGGYTVFGQTVDGFDVIDAISVVPVANNGAGERSLPVEEIIIESVRIYVKE